MEPVEDWMIVLPAKAPDKTAGGIALPEKAQDALRPAEGEVVAVGPGRVLENGARLATEVKVGQRVFWQRDRRLVEIKENDVVYGMLRERELIGKSSGT